MARVSGAKISSIEKVLAKYVFRQFYKTFFSGKVAFTLPKNAVKMPTKCQKNDSKMPAKCQQNASKMLAKCQKNAPVK